LDADLKLSSDGRLKVIVSPVFEALCQPSRYKAAYGGRGSGKSQFFADWMIIQAASRPGFRALCCREIQKSLKESAKRLLEQKIEDRGLGHLFDIQVDGIKGPGGGLIAFAGLQDHTAESIKSYEGFDVAWVEEAQTVSPRSLNLLRPTIRKPGSELWFSWNPRRRTDPVDAMFRGDEIPTGAQVVRANWNHNEWFPAELEQERLDCLRMQPEQYDHIWEGGYVTVSEGAYFARHLADAKADGRITDINPDPLLTIRLFADIGGTGGKADAFTFWAAQFAGPKIKVLNYYEAVGQEAASHLAWLRSQGYTPDRAEVWLPHDGAQHDKLVRASYETFFRDAGYRVHVVPNMGKGAATTRVEAARRLFPNIWFDERKTEAGRAALGWYHEKKDEARNIGLGPEHDWASHGADSFGLMCVAHEEPKKTQVIKYSSRGIV
jgi:phage terminase large subunit